MKLHQVLTGACNAGDRCFAVGSVEGISFVTYAAGSNIVVLSVTFERVQIIPGICHNNVQISCIDCSTDTGKIAAAYGNRVRIFEPTPIVLHNSTHKLDYHWVETGHIQTEYFIRALSWNLEGTRLLLGGRLLQLWHCKPTFTDHLEEQGSKNVQRTATFELGGENDGDSEDETNQQPSAHEDRPTADEEREDYELIWETKPAQPVRLLSFSPDGTLFATAGVNDTLVKVWFQDKPLLFPSKSMEHVAAASPTLADNSVQYAFEYLAHPGPIVSIEWRKTSKYMPRGSVANMLVTSCEDSICRLWVETVLPDDGLVNMNNFDPLAAQNPRFRTHRHKHKFMQRLKHMRHCFQLKRLIKQQHGKSRGGKMGNKFNTLPTLVSSYSVHDYHSFGLHVTGHSIGLHFHLAATINAQTDIPLVPTLPESGCEKGFVVHWLNNKEMHFTLQAEYILQELSKKAVGREDSFQNGVTIPDSEAAADDDADHQSTADFKRKGGKVRATTGDLGKFLREQQQEHYRVHSDLPSPHNPFHSLHAEHQLLSNTASMYSIATDITGTTGFGMPLGDALDHRIEALLKDWHHSPDLLYAVHPLDGSFLVWLVDWLDEYTPGSFRQSQVSFSSRLPKAVPLGDASTLSTHLALFNPFHVLDLRNLLHLEGPSSHTGPQPTPSPQDHEEQEDECHSETHVNHSSSTNKSEAVNNGSPYHTREEERKPEIPPLQSSPSPVVAMVTKHANGTLNLWHLALSDQSKFTQVLSVSHATRISGHRFRVNNISCHPVLPLLLTTSHHNVINSPDDKEVFGSNIKVRRASGLANHGYCSELILWKVETVGPLGKSGGVTELARINSPHMSAFASVAWIPTVLPSSSLGGLSNSASACFVASDGQSLRIYQAVIDARTLLAQILCSPTPKTSEMLNTSVFLDESPIRQLKLGNRTPVRLVSEQSTSRPGCILELDAMVEAVHDWKQTQFLHVFQQQLLTGKRLSPPETNTKTNEPLPEITPVSQRRVPLGQMPASSRMSLMEVSQSAVVDLQESPAFNEPFYVVVVEKENEADYRQNDSFGQWSSNNDAGEGGSSIVHVWKVIISSNSEEETSGTLQRRSTGPSVLMETIKVCTQRLPLPDGVGIVHASPAAGHLSSASIYPACFAPYVMVTACTDNTVRFWRCNLFTDSKVNGSVQECLRWEEWQMISKEGTSLLSIPGRPLSVSAAYSGRIAVAYKHGQSFSAKFAKSSKVESDDSRYVNLVVSIYECESTGGSEWVREDVIYLKNIHLPRLQSIDPTIDLTYLQEGGEQWLRKRQHSIDTLTRNLSHDELVTIDKDPGHERYQPNIQGLLSVPSTATLLTLKKSIEQRGNVCPLTQKHLVQLDWVSKEDGSHILTVGVGHRVLLYTSVSNPAVKEKFNSYKSTKSPKSLPKQSSTTALSQEEVTVRWLRLRSVELRTADGLPPLPMHLSWVRDGIFVIGMDNEMQIYSQWKDAFNEQSNETCTDDHHTGEKGHLCEDSETDLESDAEGGPAGYDDDVGEDRDVLDRELHTLAQEGRLTYAPSMSQLPRASSMHALAAAAAHLNSHKKPPAKKPVDKKMIKEVDTDTSSISLLQDCLPSYGLFEASQIACPVLPQYHPQQLMELLNSGKMNWVKAILAHLVRCISGHRGLGSDEDDEEDMQTDVTEEHSHKNWARTRTLSISSPNEPHGASRPNAPSLPAVPEELTLDYAEISAVPPLPLWLLLSADQGSANMGDNTQSAADSLFHPILEAPEDEEDDLDLLLSESPPTQKRKKKKNAGDVSNPQFFQKQYFQFGPRQARLLTSVLTHTQLPGLSNIDQMHLLALADTLASCDATQLTYDVDSGRAPERGVSHPGSESSLDACGLRFLLAARHNSYLIRCLPPAQRISLQKQGISSAHLAWAFHSESQEELLKILPAFTKANPTWAEYRELGIGWWLRSNSLLRPCIEKLAKAAYQSRGDPLDAALYYMAMKKKNVVWGLFRQTNDDRMTQFFSNNFTEERWRKAALKNAYALLGKQRFVHAVAFFLLAGSLKDAVDICLSRMHDIQLAIVITRLYEGEMESVPPGLKKLLQEKVLDNTADHDSDQCLANRDPFLRSIAFWLMAQYTDSLNTLLERHSEKGELSRTQTATSASVFNFYIYLRNHPLIIRQQLTSTAKAGGGKRTLGGVGGISVDKAYLLQEWITPLERRLYFTTAHAHFLAGCPALALEVLSKLPDHVQYPTNESEVIDDRSPMVTVQESSPVKADMFDWSTPVSTSVGRAEPEFDWSQPVGPKDETLDLKWSDDEGSESDSSDEGITMKSSIKEDVPPVAAAPSIETEPEQQDNSHLDIMAQQLKFIACLKILMGEMATLTTGFEVDGGQLRLQLYLWLDRELQALQQLCNYAPTPLSNNGDDDEEPSLLPAMPASYKSNSVVTDEPLTLHEVLIAEKMDLEAKVKRTARRRRWLRANELLVRTLLSYCSVHGSQGGGLASVRMELILLLQELQQDRRQSPAGKELTTQMSQQQLLSPLPFPSSLPLLAASVAGTKIITTDPVRHLENQIHNMLRTIIGFNSVPVPGGISFGQMCLIRDLALALSACLYQALCTSDAWSLQQQQEQQRGSVGPLARLAVVFRAMHNIAGVSSQVKRDEADLQPNSSPSKWPGVSSLRAMLAREREEDAPRLLTLLCEAFVAIYTSLLCYSMAACDSHVLYRLTGLQPTEKMWGSVFGGGTKQLVRVTTSSPPLSHSPAEFGPSQPSGPVAAAAAAVDVVQQRVRLHIKLLSQMGTPAAAGVGGNSTPKPASVSPGGPRKVSVSSTSEDLPTYKEVFVAPKLSLVACLMAKPTLRQESSFIDYDSSSSDVDEDENVDTDDDNDNTDPWDDFGDDDKKSAFKKSKANQNDSEQCKPNSLSWMAIRLATTRLCMVHIEEFLRVAGVEPQDLPVISPLSHSIQRSLHQWCIWLQKQLDAAGPAPADFIPGCTVENIATGPPIQKYRGLLDPNNTPFLTQSSTARPMRRLWCYLVRQEKVQDIFIRLVFGKRINHQVHQVTGTNNMDAMSVYSDAAAQEDLTDSMTAVSGGAAERMQDPVRIIHKDQDVIGAFCINSTNPGILAISNGKEIQELDVTPLLDAPSAVLEDECEIDLLGLDRDLDANTSSYLVVQTPGDRQMLTQLNTSLPGSASTAHFPSYAPSASHSSVPPGGPVLPVTGRGTTLLRKHKVDGVRRMCAHPLMPLYISGQGDGSVSIWEWGHVGVVSQPRSTGAYAKVTRLRFNNQGNKFGVADGDGHVALWTLRIGGGSQPHRPYYSNQCHNKGTSDFVFLGSSSVLATTGHSSESRNVVLWDTLMPQRKAIIHSFACHENGGTSLLYASQHQILISAGRKGDVCMWDLRQRTLRHKFTAHESSVAVKCMALDPNEEFFITGSADGDIKVWSLATQHVMFAFPAEHSRSSFFRSMGQGHGVSQISVDSSGRMFSCGSDGSMKLRQLPLVNRDNVVATLY